MQGYQVVEEMIIYTVEKYKCELVFSRCNELSKRYPIYDLDFLIYQSENFKLDKQSIGEVQITFSIPKRVFEKFCGVRFMLIASP